MAEKNAGGRPLSEEELQELVASTDAGARSPAGTVGTLLAVVAVAWSIFQVILASPISNYVLPGDLINNSRQVHLAFAIFLAFMAANLFLGLFFGLGGEFCAGTEVVSDSLADCVGAAAGGGSFFDEFGTSCSKKLAT